MKAFRYNKFSLVELALAIGLIAIGLTAVIGAFPVASKSEEKALVDYYVADVAENAYAYIHRMVASDWNNVITELPESEPTSEVTTASTLTATSDSTLYQVADANNGIYAVRINMAKDGANAVNDILTGEMKVWRSDIGPVNFGKTQRTIGSNKGIGVNMEISVPVDKPYAQREKYNYYFEMFNHDIVTSSMDEERFENRAPYADLPVYKEPTGEIAVNAAGKKIRVKVLETEYYNDNQDIFLSIRVEEPSDPSPTGTDYDFNDPLASVTVVDGTADGDKPVWEMEVEDGTTFAIKGWSDYGGGITPKWSTDDTQVLTLLNGDAPQLYDEGNGGVAPMQILQDEGYVTDGVITLEENQVLYLFEIGQTTEFYANGSRNSGFDRQDIVLLAELVDS